MQAKLNSSKINELRREAAKAGKPAHGFDSHIEGLAIVVYPSGKGAWRIDYREPRTGQRRRRKIGKYPALTVVQAREVASEKFQRIAIGLDPFAEPKQDDRITVERAWKRYVAEYLSNRSKKYRYDADGYGRREIVPRFGSIDIADLARGELLTHIDKRRAETRAAGDTLYRHCHAFLEWCVDVELIEANPIAKKRLGRRGRARGSERGRTNRRARSLINSHRGDEDLGRVLAAAEIGREAGKILPLEIRPSEIYCDATIVLLATGKRLSEVLEAPVKEFDGQNTIWTIPPERRKGIRSDTPADKCKPEVVPLFGLAREVVARRRGTVAGPFVFSVDGSRPYSNISTNTEALLKLAGVEGVVHHDYRRTISTKLASWRFGAEVRHAVLGHVGALDGDELDGVYNLHTYAEEKGEALERWDGYLAELQAEWVPILLAELRGKDIEIADLTGAATGGSLVH